MAPKRPPPLLDPPPVSSSEEEDEEEISDEEADDHVEEDPKTKPKPLSREEEDDEDDDEDGDDEDEDEDEEEEEETPTKQPSVQKPITQQTQSLSESDPDEDSEIESPTASAFTIKPIVSKSLNDLTKSAPSQVTSTSTTLSKCSSKRQTEAEPNGNKSAKKRKLSNLDEDGPVEQKKSGINRLWSEEDEIAILEGVIDFQTKENIDPFANMGKFHEFVKKLLKVDVSKSQLMSKIKRLKKKYRINAVKGENGENPVFSKAHDHNSFELSKKIWGGGASSAVDANGKSEKRSSKKKGKVNNSMNSTKEKDEEFAIVDSPEGLNSEVKTNQEAFWSLYSGLKKGFSLSMSNSIENFVKENMSLIGNAKAKELEEKWNKLRVNEIEVYLKRLELIKEQTELVLAAMKSSNS